MRAISEPSADSVNLSRLLGGLRFLGADWVRIRVGAQQGFSMPTGDPIACHFVARGTVQLQIDQQPPIVLEAGQTAMLPQSRPHSLKTEGGTIRQRLTYFDDTHDLDIPRTIDIGVTSDQTSSVILSAQMHFDWPAELPKPQSLPTVLLGTRTYRHDRTAAESAARALENTAARPGASICLSRFAELLFVRELRDVLIAHPQLLTLRDELTATIVRAIDAVRMKPGHPWTVERLARHVGMSRSTFAAAFKGIYDRGPMEVVTAQRMEISARMLRESNMRVKTIASKVGYHSDTAFLRRFIASFGMSPTAYKKQGDGAERHEQGQWLDLLG